MHESSIKCSPYRYPVVNESDPKPDSLLITGHRGLLGSACVRMLSGKYNVVVFEGDLLDQSLFRCWMSTNRPRRVIHCAAKVGGVKSNRDLPVEFLTQNLKIQSNVIEGAYDLGVEDLVFVGSSCLFPRNATTPVSEEALLTGPFEPSVEAYAVAKLAGYELCKAYKDEYIKRFITVCPANLYGPGDNYGPSAHVVPALIKRISDCKRTGEPLIVWGDGSAVREFMYVDDAAQAIGLALLLFDGDILNIGTGVGTTIKDLVYMLVAIAGGGIEVVFDESQPTGIPKKTFNISKLANLGFTPKTSLIQGLEKTWQDFNKSSSFRCK